VYLCRKDRDARKDGVPVKDRLVELPLQAEPVVIHLRLRDQRGIVLGQAQPQRGYCEIVTVTGRRVAVPDLTDGVLIDRLSFSGIDGKRVELLSMLQQCGGIGSIL
jgi:hypothetical protein